MPYFETIIRYLGGLLSAYALSNDRLHIDRADEMVAKLEAAFETESGLPFFGVYPARSALPHTTHIAPELDLAISHLVLSLGRLQSLPVCNWNIII